MLKALALASSLLLAQTAAQAGVTYNWVSDSYSPSIQQVSGSIVFEDHVGPNGSVATDYSHCGYCGDESFDIPGVASFSFAVNGVSFSMPSFLGFNLVSLALDLQGAAGLSGSIYLEDGQSTVSLASVGGTSWLIDWFSSDNGHTGCFEEGCSGATGHWALAGTPPTGAVPEPGSLALLLPALAGAWAARRRPQRHAA